MKLFRNCLTRTLTARLIKRDILDNILLSAVSNAGAISSVGYTGDPFIKKGWKSNKTFYLPDGSPAPPSDVRLLQHPLQDPACTIDMVSSLRGVSLLSTSKLTNARYVSIYDEEEVNIYDGRTAKIAISKAAVLEECRCPRNKL